MNAKEYLDSRLLEQGYAFTADDYWLLYRLWSQLQPSSWFREMMQPPPEGEYRFKPLGRTRSYSRGLYVPR